MRFRGGSGGSIAAALFLFLFVGRCNFINGGGSNTGNARLGGVIVDPVGTCIPHGTVRLYKSDAVPVLPDSGETPAVACDTTDAAGRYYFPVVDSGLYNLLCQDSSGILKALRCERVVHPSDSVFDTIVLYGTTSLQGTVTNPQPPVTICFVPGSPYIATVNDTSGTFRLSNIPWGPYPVVFENLNAIDSLGCSYTYTLEQLPDTSVWVTVTLDCP